METQPRPSYTSDVGMPVIMHEPAHQWYGDSVTVRSWADTCLNECFASYATWMWAAHEQGADLDARDAFAELLREWPAEHKNGHADWPQFERFVMDLTGENLRGFFDVWFHSMRMPKHEFLYPGSLGG